MNHETEKALGYYHNNIADYDYVLVIYSDGKVDGSIGDGISERYSRISGQITPNEVCGFQEKLKQAMHGLLSEYKSDDWFCTTVLNLYRSGEKYSISYDNEAPTSALGEMAAEIGCMVDRFRK